LIWPTNVPSEEWATWAGDVGQAAAKYAVDEFYARRKKNHKEYFQETASDADLLGDIDSFTIRLGLAGGIAPRRQLMQRLRPNQPLSEILLQYFRLTSTGPGRARTQRIQSFITAYGGIVEGRNLRRGHRTLTRRLQRRIGEFANYFAMFLMLQYENKFGKPPRRKANSPTVSKLTNNAVQRMTRLFVDWLMTQLRK
jgi:hypothetical protein